MNILIISKYLFSKEVGFETRLFALSRLFVRKGHNVNIISSVDNYFGRFPKTYTKNYNNEIVEGIRVTWIKSLSYKKTISTKRILSWLDFEWKLLNMKTEHLGQPDIVIVSSLSLLSILNGVRLKRKFQCKLIFEIRDIWPLTLVEEGGFSPSNPFVKILGSIEKWGYRKSDLVVGTMPNIQQHVEEVCRQPIKCACVPFGFKFEDYEHEGTIHSNNYRIPANKFIVGYAGSIGLSNGLDTFVEVIKRLKNNRHIYFIVLGSGGLLEKYIEYLKDCNNVLFLGKVKRQDVKNVLDRCDILYFAALNSKVWKYGWSPNKLIDYMLSGKPVLASYSGYQSMINEANSGVFVPAEDADALERALLELYSTPKSELQSIGQRGKEWIIKNRQWESLADDYLAIMQEVVSSSASLEANKIK